jgi:hypothetical protein
MERNTKSLLLALAPKGAGAKGPGEKFVLDKLKKVWYNQSCKEVTEMDRRCFKKTGEELQQYLAFRRRGSKVANKKGKGSYNRQKFKRGEKNSP